MVLRNIVTHHLWSGGSYLDQDGKQTLVSPWCFESVHKLCSGRIILGAGAFQKSTRPKCDCQCHNKNPEK
jgi:hypothetical protein